MALSIKNDEIYKLEANLERAHQDLNIAQVNLKRLAEEKVLLRESNAEIIRNANMRILTNAKKMERKFASLKNQVDQGFDSNQDLFFLLPLIFLLHWSMLSIGIMIFSFFPPGEGLEQSI
jgi:hypothetical protein